MVEVGPLTPPLHPGLRRLQISSSEVPTLVRTATVLSGYLPCTSEGAPPDANLLPPPDPTCPCQVCTYLQLLLGVRPQQVTDIFIVDLQVGGPDQKLGILCTLQGVGGENKDT